VPNAGVDDSLIKKAAFASDRLLIADKGISRFIGQVFLSKVSIFTDQA